MALKDMFKTRAKYHLTVKHTETENYKDFYNPGNTIFYLPTRSVVEIPSVLLHSLKGK